MLVGPAIVDVDGEAGTMHLARDQFPTLSLHVPVLGIWVKQGWSKSEVKAKMVPPPAPFHV